MFAWLDIFQNTNTRLKTIQTTNHTYVTNTTLCVQQRPCKYLMSTDIICEHSAGCCYQMGFMYAASTRTTGTQPRPVNAHRSLSILSMTINLILHELLDQCIVFSSLYFFSFSYLTRLLHLIWEQDSCSDAMAVHFSLNSTKLLCFLPHVVLIFLLQAVLT